MPFKHPCMISEILIRHRLGARHLAVSWGQTLNNAAKAIESQYFMPMTDLDRGGPGQLPRLIMCHFSSGYTHLQLSFFSDSSVAGPFLQKYIILRHSKCIKLKRKRKKQTSKTFYSDPKTKKVVA